MTAVAAGTDTAAALARTHAAATCARTHALTLTKADGSARGFGDIGFSQSAQGERCINHQAGDVGDIHLVRQWAGDHGTDDLRNRSRGRRHDQQDRLAGPCGYGDLKVIGLPTQQLGQHDLIVFILNLQRALGDGSMDIRHIPLDPGFCAHGG